MSSTVMENGVNRIFKLVPGVDNHCLLPLFTLFWLATSFGEGKFGKVAVTSAVLHDLAERIKSETSHEFQFELLPSFNGEDELTTMDSLYHFLDERKINIVLGDYSKTLAQVTEKLEIQFMVTSFGVMAPERNVLQVAPSWNDVVCCCMDIIEAYHFTQVGLFCHETILSNYPSLPRQIMSNPAIGLRLWPVTPGPINITKVKQGLLTQRDLGVLEFLLLTPVSSSMVILDTAKSLGMLATPYSWVMLNLGSEKSFEALMTDQLTNFTTINLVLPSHLLTLEQDKNTTTILEEAIVSDSLTLMDNLSIIMNNGLTKNRKNTFQGRTGNLQFGINGLRNNFSFTIFDSEMNDLKQSGEWWKEGDKHRLFLYPRVGGSKFLDHDSLNGKTIKVVSILEKPWLMLMDVPDPNGNVYEGYSYDLILELSKELDFKFEIYLVPDGKYGVLHQNGKWDGIVGELVAKNATLSSAPLGIDSNREAAIDFTVPFMHRGVTVLIRSPKIQNFFFKFMRPLSTYVWFAVLVALGLFSALMCTVEHGGTAWRTDLPRLNNFVESWWFILGAIASGVSMSSPVTISGRFLASAWWFFSMILISTYTANLAAFLTVDIINPPISGVGDLLGQTHIKYGTVRNSMVQVFFQNTSIEPYTLLNNQMVVTDSNVDSTEDGLRKVREGNYAFLWDEPVNSFTASTDCNFTNVGSPFAMRGYGLGLSIGTPFKDDLSMAILKLAEDGTLNELEHKWWERSRCPDLSQPTMTPSSSPAINTENVAGIFFILVGGVVLALVGLLFEKAITLANSCWKAKEEESEEMCLKIYC